VRCIEIADDLARIELACARATSLLYCLPYSTRLVNSLMVDTSLSLSLSLSLYFFAMMTVCQLYSVSAEVVLMVLMNVKKCLTYLPGMCMHVCMIAVAQG
jgi:hypothetical protein